MANKNINRFQLVILDSPIENWSDPAVQNFFNKMVTLKKKGYESCYPQGVLPVDTSDFFASHVLLCEKTASNELIPVMGYKTISLSKCIQFNQNFPGLSLVQSARMPNHVEVVQNIIEKCTQNKKELAYLGSWTVDPEFKRRCPEDIHLRSAFIIFYNLFYQERSVAEVIIGGTLRFKTENLFSELGHLPLARNEEILPNIYVTHLVKEPVQVMHAQRFLRPPTLQTRMWEEVWENRLVLSPVYAKLKPAA